jgi:hypothetical protein
VSANLDSVSVATYGAAFLFTGKHCQYADQDPSALVDDCVQSGVRPSQQARTLNGGGAAGWSNFQGDWQAAWPNPTNQAQMDDLGTVFGAVAFGGPGGLPVLRGSSFPTEVGRTNANLFAYQKFVFGGTATTDLALVVNLDYAILSNWNNASVAAKEEGVTAGGAHISTTLTVVDATKVPPEAMGAVKNFNSLVCGAERDPDAQLTLPNGQPWPDGSILGMAIYGSPGSQQGPHSVTLKLVKCSGSGIDPSGSLVQVSPGQEFYLAASLQTPARGRWSQAPNTPPANNGYVDAAHTMRVVPDPTAPPEVLQQLANGLESSCTTCESPPLVLIDVKPGSLDNPINVSSTGVIPVAILGSDHVDVTGVNTKSLRLGALVVRSAKDSTSQCARSDVNYDGRTDLVCQFQNVASNWQPGQTTVPLTGTFNNGDSIFASDQIRLVP